MRAVVLRDYDAAGAAVGMDGGEAKIEHGATVLPPRSDYQRVFGIEQYGYGGGKHVAGPVCAVGLGFHTQILTAAKDTTRACVTLALGRRADSLLRLPNFRSAP